MKDQENVIIGIYKITSPSGKIYIGQSVNIYRRWYVYKNKNNLNIKTIGILLYRSLKKHGYELHKFEIIEECLIKQLDKREIYWIKFYKSNREGLNIREGGMSPKNTLETIEKIRNKAIGRKLSEEAKNKISESKKGNKNNLGKKHTKEHNEKIGKANTGRSFGKERSEKIIMKISKPIIQYDLEGNFIKEWGSATMASRTLGFNQGQISRCCRGIRSNYKNFIFAFKK